MDNTMKILGHRLRRYHGWRLILAADTANTRNTIN